MTTMHFGSPFTHQQFEKQDCRRKTAGNPVNVGFFTWKTFAFSLIAYILCWFLYMFTMSAFSVAIMRIGRTRKHSVWIPSRYTALQTTIGGFQLWEHSQLRWDGIIPVSQVVFSN